MFWRSAARRLLDVALPVSLACALLAWLFDPFRAALGSFHLSIRWGWKPLIAVAICVALRAALKRMDTEPRPGRFVDRLALAFGMTLALLSGLEGALALAGVPKGEAVFVVKKADGAPMRADGSMVHDADLLWRFQPGAMFNGRVVNERGFLGRSSTLEPVPGTRRVICMGDSCTGQGVPPYSDLLHEGLVARPPHEQVWESFNVGVHGYTVLQGLALFRQRIAAMKPDVVTLYFGWNGHWLADEADHIALSRSTSPLLAALKNGVASKRLSTLLRRPAPAATAKRVLRVPPDRYARGLSDLVEAIRAAGALPIVLTAPRAERISGRLVHQGQTTSVDDANQLHDAYAELTRAVAREWGVPLLDLAQQFAASGRRDLFSDDGIHLTDAGRQLVADRIFEIIAQRAATP